MAVDKPPVIADLPSLTTADSGPYGLGASGEQVVQHANSLFGTPSHAGPTVDKKTGKKLSGGGLTVNQVFDYFRGLSTRNPTQLAQVQMMLYRGGFYSSTDKFLPGVVRTGDLTAMKNALKGVQNTGQSFLDYLNSAATLGDQLGINAAGGRQHTPVSYTSPTDIQTVIESVAPQVIGRGLAPGEVQRIINGYHSLEATATNQANAVSDAGGDGGYTNPPTVQDYVAQQAKSLHPDETQTKSLADLSKQVLAGLNLGSTGDAPVDRVF